MACLRCRLKPIGVGAYGNPVEYMHAMPATREDPWLHSMHPAPGIAVDFMAPRICQSCGTVYCEPVQKPQTQAPLPPAAPTSVPPVPPIVPRLPPRQ